MTRKSWISGTLDENAIDEKIGDFCDYIDREIETGNLTAKRNGRWSIVISGSSAFIVFGVSNRYLTDDIDICEYNTYQAINELLEDFEMNTSHAEFPFCFPSDYLDRIYIFRSGNYIDVYMPSWSDLAFSKLGSYREQDLLDLNGLDPFDGWDD